MQDYEWAGLQRKLAWRAARRVIVPDAIPLDRLEAAGASADKLVRYPGLKEDYYLAGFEPDPAVLCRDRARTRSACCAARAEDGRVLDGRPPAARDLGLPRRQPALRGGARPALRRPLGGHRPDPPDRRPGRRGAARAGEPTLVVPDRAIDAQSLIALADLVVSAGGTMNREAVALGVPVRTIFSGRMGAVDERLIAEGRLGELGDPGELELRKREAEPGPVHPRDPAILVDGALEAAA